MGRFTVKIFGDIISEIKTEIHRIHLTTASVVNVYGFGSFFRDYEAANDLDILVVLNKSDLPVEEIRRIRAGFRVLENRIGYELDITFFTRREFSERPLLEMDELVCLL